jgi:hypothetical protein
VPGQIGGQGQPPQGPAHLARAPPGTDQLRDLAVGGQATAGDQGHRGPNPLIKRCTFRLCHHQPFCVTPPNPAPRPRPQWTPVSWAPGKPLLCREPQELAAITLDPAAMPSNEGPIPFNAAGPGAEPPEQRSVQPTSPSPGKGSPLPSPFGSSQSQELCHCCKGC